MQKIFRHGTVWFLTINLLASTMGLTVHSLYCLCKDSIQISVFEQQPECGKSDKEVPSCCKKTLTDNLCEKEHDCTQKDKKYVKLATQFTFFKTEIDLQQPEIQLASSWFPIKSKVIVDDIFEGVFLNKPPPEKPFGKTLLPFTQSFLC